MESSSKPGSTKSSSHTNVVNEIFVCCSCCVVDGGDVILALMDLVEMGEDPVLEMGIDIVGFGVVGAGVGIMVLGKLFVGLFVAGDDMGVGSAVMMMISGKCRSQCGPTKLEVQLHTGPSPARFSVQVPLLTQNPRPPLQMTGFWC